MIKQNANQNKNAKQNAKQNKNAKQNNLRIHIEVINCHWTIINVISKCYESNSYCWQFLAIENVLQIKQILL